MTITPEELKSLTRVSYYSASSRARSLNTVLEKPERSGIKASPEASTAELHKMVQDTSKHHDAVEKT